MKLLRIRKEADLEDLKTPTSLAVGNFDGCHLGHQELIRVILKHKPNGLTPTVLSFYPHPDQFFRRDSRDDDLLFTPDLKRMALAELGVEQVVLQDFDEPFSLMTREEFTRRYLAKSIGAKVVAIGPNFRFGYQRKGDVAFLQANGPELSIKAVPVPFAEHEGICISSSRIRKTLRNMGDAAAAARMLGRPYSLAGIVTQGHQRGRQIGIPTLNLGQIQQLIPRNGVYQGRLHMPHLHGEPTVMSVPNNAVRVVVNVGTRPTFLQNEAVTSVEAHAFENDLPFEIYGKPCEIFFEHRLRDEHQFESREALVNQIRKDIESARRV